MRSVELSLIVFVVSVSTYMIVRPVISRLFSMAAKTDFSMAFVTVPNTDVAKSIAGGLGTWSSDLTSSILLFFS